MKPAKRFDARLRAMTEDEAMAKAREMADEHGIPLPVGKSGKTTLRIVGRTIRLAPCPDCGKRDYDFHRAALLVQLAAL